ncbi:MAG: hypothetical protein M1522_07535 [Actinobacteria bacterium]|nr:hypothetical protein [Actinomycetota bacterium]
MSRSRVTGTVASMGVANAKTIYDQAVVAYETTEVALQAAWDVYWAAKAAREDAYERMHDALGVLREAETVQTSIG